MSKHKILVVDADLNVCELIAGYFTQRNYAVEVAITGSDCLASVRNELPDVILIETELPDMSGYDVVRKLCEDETTKYIPVIYLTELQKRHPGGILLS